MSDTTKLEIVKAKKFTGTPKLQGDTLLSCHGIFMAVLSQGKSTLNNIPQSDWLIHQIKMLQSLGYQIEREEGTLHITGHGQAPTLLNSPIKPDHEIILMALGGIFAGFKSPNLLQIHLGKISGRARDVFAKVFDCDQIQSPDHTNVFQIKGVNSVSLEKFPGSEYLIKTALLYYHASARTGTQLNCFNTGPDHLENILQAFSSDIEYIQSATQELSEFEKRMARKLKTASKPEAKIILPERFTMHGSSVNVPNDISLSSIYVLAATLIPGSQIELENVLLNPSRSKFFTALRRMDASIEIIRKKEHAGEAYGDIKVKYSTLKGRKFDYDSLSGMNEEIPLLIIATAFAEGKSVFRDLTHLRTYEHDLLKQIISTLKEIQVEIGEIEDGLVIQGNVEYDGHTFNTLNNAMLGFAWLILGLKSHGTTTIENIECMENLFPGAIENIRHLAAA